MSHLVRATFRQGRETATRETHVATLDVDTVRDLIATAPGLGPYSNMIDAVPTVLAGLKSDKRLGQWGWVDFEIARYEVLDDNDDVLESANTWWIAAQSARRNGFRVRDNETGEIAYDAHDDDND